MISTKLIWQDFCRHPFRLFFLSACLAVICAALVWPISAIGLFVPETDPITLHVFWFVHVAGGAAFAGFLLTGLVAWTDYKGSLILPSRILWGIWLIALLFAPWYVVFSAYIMWFFWLFLSVFCLIMVVKARDTRQISIVFLLCVMTIFSLCYAITLNLDWLKVLFNSSMVGIVIVSFRVSLALGREALQSSHLENALFMPNVFYKNLVISLLYLMIFAHLALNQHNVDAWLNMAVGVAMLALLKQWHYAVLLKQHYIRTMYAAILCIGLSYCWQGIGLLSEHSHTGPALHLASLAGFMMMIYLIMNIAGLRHSGQVLIFPLLSRLGLLGLLLAGISRSVLTTYFPEHILMYSFYLPGICVVLTAVFYLVVFIKIFIKYPANNDVD